METLSFASLLWSIVAMLFGVAVHIAKKAAKFKLQDQSFNLKNYLVDHPYQTFLSFAAGIGGLLTLYAAGTLEPAAAFFAGVAANSLGDIAPGNRGDKTHLEVYRGSSDGNTPGVGRNEGSD